MSTSWFTITALDEKTYALSESGHWEHVHSFLLIGDTKAILIDTGLGIASIRAVVRSLTDLPITVITTHVHTDHIGGHHEFSSIYVHQADAKWLVNGIEGRTLDAVRKYLVRDVTQPLPPDFDIDTYKIYTGKPTRLLHDQDCIDLDGRMLRIHHTPGHSPGHICIHDTSTGYLFTGDLIYFDAPIYAFYPSTNPIDLVCSLEKMSELKGVTKIYGSHHQLGIDASFLETLNRIVADLKATNYARGIHEYGRFSVYF